MAQKLKKEIGTFGLLLTSVAGIIGSGWLFGAFHAAENSGTYSISLLVAQAVLHHVEHFIRRIAILHLPPCQRALRFSESEGQNFFDQRSSPLRIVLNRGQASPLLLVDDAQPLEVRVCFLIVKTSLISLLFFGTCCHNRFRVQH